MNLGGHSSHVIQMTALAALKWQKVKVKTPFGGVISIPTILLSSYLTFTGIRISAIPCLNLGESQVGT